MSDLYTRLYDRVEDLRADDHTPDRIVVPAKKWRDVKNQAEVLEGEGYAGSDLTLVNGVKTLHSSNTYSARVVFEVNE